MHSNNNVAMKRIQKEQRDMQDEKSAYFYAEPLENEPFEWHFTIRGPDNTDFANGFYHGVITLPNSYPFRPPFIVFLTPSGRFSVNEKICLTFTNFHPEYWQPAWTIRNILQALVSFMPVDEDSLSIGATTATKEDRQQMAKRSIEFSCPQCGPIRAVVKDKLLPMNEENKKQQPKITDESIFKFAPEKQLKQQNHDQIIKEAHESVLEEAKHLQEVIEQKLQELKEKDQHSSENKDDIFNLDDDKSKDEKVNQSGKKNANKDESQEKQNQKQKQQEDEREKLKKIRDKGLRVYKKRLLQQLESDCRKKLWIINVLYLICLSIVAMMYYSDFIIEIRLYDLIK